MFSQEIENTRITVVPRCRGAATVRTIEVRSVPVRQAFATIPPVSWVELNDENAVGWSVYFLKRVLSSFNV